MADGSKKKQLGSAILSLLVVADQRCPGIIGHAHLLYYARLGTKLEDTRRTFAQLKKDATDLFRAIADAEAAINQTTPDATSDVSGQPHGAPVAPAD